jgi:hypothetical protein
MHTLSTMKIEDIPPELVQEIKEQALREFCQKAGSTVTRARVLTARENGKSGGRPLVCGSCGGKMSRTDSSWWICDACGQTRPRVTDSDGNRVRKGRKLSKTK